jgi:hypothetical protein
MSDNHSGIPSKIWFVRFLAMTALSTTNPASQRGENGNEEEL